MPRYEIQDRQNPYGYDYASPQFALRNFAPKI